MEMPETEQIDLNADESATDPGEPTSYASADAAIELASRWVDNALLMLWTARRAAETGSRTGVAGLSLNIVRRHFQTGRVVPGVSDTANIGRIETTFRQMKLALLNSASIFSFVDDETASMNTRGIYGSEVPVAAYAYSHGHIALTNDFPGLGLNCRAAVIIHQLAHYANPAVRDAAGVRGPAYESLDLETALVNVHCYPNFAVNATPPFLDERYGMTRPDE